MDTLVPPIAPKLLTREQQGISGYIPDSAQPSSTPFPTRLAAIIPMINRGKHFDWRVAGACNHKQPIRKLTCDRLRNHQGAQRNADSLLTSDKNTGEEWTGVEGNSTPDRLREEL